MKKKVKSVAKLTNKNDLRVWIDGDEVDKWFTTMDVLPKIWLNITLVSRVILGK